MKLRTSVAIGFLVLGHGAAACSSTKHGFDEGETGTSGSDGGSDMASAGGSSEGGGSAGSAVLDPAGGMSSADAGSPPTDSSPCETGVTRACSEDPAIDQLGNCSAGTETCVGGSWTACSIKPATSDKCTPGDDANCNGTPNEGCPCVNGQTQPCGPSAEVGICHPGTQTCANSVWGTCVGAVLAAERDCTSSADNDCDGANDNTIDSVCKCAQDGKQTCDAHAGDGKGRCHAGEQVCQVAADKKSSAWGACTGSVGPAAKDSCQPQNDDNCNGQANEGCSCVNGTKQACGETKGICKAGQQTCVGSAWGACDGTFAAARDCTSGLDNDCNGTVDKLDSTCACGGASSRACNQHPGKDGVGPCKAGTEACVVSSDKTSSSWSGSCQGSVAPLSKDSCDANKDEDCSGTAGDSCSCINASVASCGSCTQKTCSNGSYGACVSTCAAGQGCVSNVCKTRSCSGVACGGDDGAGGVCKDAQGTCVAEQQCVGATCTCRGPVLSCNDGKKVCSGWFFESGSEGWVIDGDKMGGNNGAVKWTSTRSHSGEPGGGTHSISFPYGSGSGYLDVGFILCGGSVFPDLSLMKGMTAWVYLEPDANSGPLQSIDVDITAHYYHNGDYAETDINRVPSGSWQKLNANVPVFANDWVRFNFEFHVSAADPWSGTIYLDDVEFVHS